LLAPVAAQSIELDGFVRGEVRELYPALDEDVERVEERWIENMLPEFYPGYVRSMVQFLERHEQDKQCSIYYCGDYLAGATAGAACASGRRAARRLIAEWGV
jgi:oxygen-dependent protoporphyrinogen oxidase